VDLSSLKPAGTAGRTVTLHQSGGNLTVANSLVDTRGTFNMNLSGGNFSFYSKPTLSHRSGSSTNINITGGTMYQSNRFLGTYTVNMNISGNGTLKHIEGSGEWIAINGSELSFTAQLSESGNIDTSDASLYIGSVSWTGGTGILNQSGGNVLVGSTLFISPKAGGYGEYNFSSGQLTMKTGQNVQIGSASCQYAIFHVNGSSPIINLANNYTAIGSSTTSANVVTKFTCDANGVTRIDVPNTLNIGNTNPTALEVDLNNYDVHTGGNVLELFSYGSLSNGPFGTVVITGPYSGELDYSYGGNKIVYKNIRPKGTIITLD
jgi:hypothetical protein